jgi:hypothetical protein
MSTTKDTTQELENYRKAVKKAKELKIEIRNPSIEHAGILMDELLNYAIEQKMPVKLVSGCLEDKFYNGLKDKFKKALDSNCEISVLVACKENEIQNKDLYDFLRTNNNASIKTIDESDVVIHFMLVGNAAYRVETSKEYKTAIGHFDNNAIGELLLSRFKEYSNKEFIN